MMMQLGTAMTEVVEEQKASKGWWAVVKNEDGVDFVYVQKYGSKTLVCSANIKESDLGTIKKEEALKACDSIAVKQ